MKTLHIKSRKHTEMIDITRDVLNIVCEDEVTDGVVVIFTPHTTAAITINENADPDVCRDMIKGMNKVIPLLDDYQHLEGNSAAHIKSSLFGASETLIINNGKIVLGTWQGIYLCEFDGPRQRKVEIKVIGK